MDGIWSKRATFEPIAFSDNPLNPSYGVVNWVDKTLIFMTNYRRDPAESLEEGKTFKERCINRVEDTESPPIKQWYRNAFLPEQRTHRREMKLTMLQPFKLSTDCLNIAQ